MTAPAQPSRLAALDVWRGLVVVLMAVDHAAFFQGRHPMPEGLKAFGVTLRPRFDSELAWLTRFVTHYCAPGFVFLAGASVVLLAASRAARGAGSWSISAHLLLRGALLVVLEYTVVKWGWGSEVGDGFFQVIACIGVCLGLGAGLRYLPGAVAGVLGLALLFGHPLLADPKLVPWLTEIPAHWRRVLLEPGMMVDRWPTLYPVLPWLAPFLLGIGYGKALVAHRERTLRWSWLLGVACLLGWLVLRLTDGFAAQISSLTNDAIEQLGNLTPYQPKRGWMDFFMMSKYPPAADFVLWTVGGGLLFCAAVATRDLASRAVFWPLRTFGRVPLLFYCTHLFLYRGLAGELVGRDRWLESSWASVWLVWLLGLVVLLPVCWGFVRLKRRFPGFPLDLL